MSLRRKLSPGFSRAVNYLLRARAGVRHATGEPPDQDAATTIEKLDAALNNMGHGLEPARAFFVSMESEQGSAFLM